MICTRIFAPALFNSNVKDNRIRHVPKCKSKLFLTSKNNRFTVELNILCKIN